MRVIIAGGREFNNYALLKYRLDILLASEIEPVDIIVSGGAPGADTLGEQWASKNGYPIRYYLPDWDAHGKAAGPIRNKEMARNADILVAFWNGKSRGTEHMIKTALKWGLEVHVYRYT